MGLFLPFCESKKSFSAFFKVVLVALTTQELRLSLLFANGQVILMVQCATGKNFRYSYTNVKKKSLIRQKCVSECIRFC